MTQIKEKKPRKSRAKVTVVNSPDAIAPVIQNPIVEQLEKVKVDREQQILSDISAEIQREKDNRKKR